jgi:hypothetical protein
VVKTANGVTITNGLRVLDYDYEIGTVDLDYRDPYPETNQNNGHVEWWFYVRRDSGGHKLMSESRVTTRHPSTGKVIE